MQWFLCGYRRIHVSPRMSCNGSYAGIGRSTYPPVCHAMVLMRVSPDPRIPSCVMQWFLCGFRPRPAGPAPQECVLLIVYQCIFYEE